MKAAGTIPPQDWMTAPDTHAVIDALTAEGQSVRFVGGCVRDALIGRKVKDVDLATPDPPEKVMRLLRRAGLKAVPTGLDHGTVTAVSDHHPYEITTLRKDVETYGRRAKVAFTDDWTADAARRDFTMNAMFCAPDGTVYDPFDGWPDLLAGRVRFVGDPDRRIQEDYLRLLRFFRFHAHYGRGQPDPEGLAAAERHAGGLTTLAGERLHDELAKLLRAPDPGPVAQVMHDHAILTAALPEAQRPDRLARLARVERELGIAAEPIRRLAAWLAPSVVEPDALAERLRLSRRERRRLAELVTPPVTVTSDATPGELRRALHRYGSDLVRDLLLLDAAARPLDDGKPDLAGVGAALSEIDRWTPKRLPVDGRDVQALGGSAGPKTGELLRAVEDWWIEQDFRPSRDACLEKLTQLVAERA